MSLAAVTIRNRLGADYARADTMAIADGLGVFLEGRFATVEDISRVFRGRYQATQEVNKVFRGRYGQAFSGKIFRGRYSTVRTIMAIFIGRYSVDGPELGSMDPSPIDPGSGHYPGFGRSAGRLGWQCGIGDLVWSMSANGIALNPPSPVLDLTLNESGAHSWSLSFPDPQGFFHPRFSARHGNGWEGAMTADSSKVFRCSVGWHKGGSLSFSGVARSSGHERSADAGRGIVFKWSGVCDSFKMYDEGVTQSTLRSSRGGVAYQGSVIQSALLEKGIPIVGSLGNLRVLRLLHRQNRTVAELIQRVCARNGLGWAFTSAGIKFYRLVKGSPRFVYDGDAAISAEGWNSESSDLVSKVMIRRVAESGDVATNPITATLFGDNYSVNFPEPLYGVTYRPLVQSLGVFSNLIFRDPDGNVVAVRNPRGGVYARFLYGAPLNNIASVSFTFGAAENVIALEGFGQIVFTGRPGDKGDSEYPAGFDTTFSVEVVSAALQAIVGDSLRELPADEMIGTAADASAYGALYLEKLLLYHDPKELTVPFNPGLFPGETVGERDPFLGNSIRTGFLRQVRHRISLDPAQLGSSYVASGWEA